MCYGLKEQHVKLVQSVLTKYPEIDEAVLYGSRAKGNYRNGSDIDLVLKGKNLEVSLLARIKMELEDSDLPHQVDLSIYHFIDNKKLLEHIKRVGVSFYKKE